MKVLKFKRSPLSIYIHDWISPFKTPSDWWFILTQQSMGGNEYGKSCQSVTCLFSRFEAFDDAFKVHFQDFIFTPYQRYW